VVLENEVRFGHHSERREHAAGGRLSCETVGLEEDSQIVGLGNELEIRGRTGSNPSSMRTASR